MTVTNRARQHQLANAPEPARRTITTRQLTISLATATITAWTWQRTGGDPALTGLIGILAGAAFNHHVA